MTQAPRARLKTVGTELSVNTMLALLTVTTMSNTGATVCPLLILANSPLLLQQLAARTNCPVTWTTKPPVLVVLLLLLLALGPTRPLVAISRTRLKTQNI